MLGTSVGPYRVIQRLGAGGMGEVYLAEDTRLRRKVALKRLRPEAVLDSEARAYALREARAAARLHHPGIATIFDIIENSDTLVIVMEYVDGETLSARIKRGALPVAEALDLAIQLADALADAHSHGVLHCDLKPANLHLTPANRPKILDFGLAQLSAGTRASDETRIATTVHSSLGSSMSGSPGYLAPERLSETPPDERSDVYSLGVVIFEMLTGRRAFPGGGLVAVAVQALTTPAPAPSSINPEIPPAVDQVVLKALTSDPAERFQNARELGDALRSVVRGEHIAMPAPMAPTARPVRWRAALIAAAVVVLAAGAIAISGWRPWPARMSRPWR